MSPQNNYKTALGTGPTAPGAPPNLSLAGNVPVTPRNKIPLPQPDYAGHAAKMVDYNAGITPPNAAAQGADMMPPMTADPFVGGNKTQPVIMPPNAETQGGDMMAPMEPGRTALGNPPTVPDVTLAGNVPPTGSTPGVSDLISTFQTQADAANAANEVRFKDATTLYDQIMASYAPGGSFGTGAMASYQQGKNQAISQATQGLVSAGLQNTTNIATMGPRYEQEVGNQFRLNLADTQMQRLNEARVGKAGVIERKVDQAPSPELMAQLTQTAASAPTEIEGTAGTGDTGATGTAGSVGATGAAGTSGGGSTYAAPDNIYYSGMVEPISDVQYRAETQRVNKLQRATKLVDTTATQISKLQSKLASLPTDDPKAAKRRASLQKRLDKAEAKLKTAETDAEKYDNTNAQISSASYASSQATRKQATAAEEAAKQSLRDQTSLAKYGAQISADARTSITNQASMASAFRTPMRGTSSF